MNTIDEIVDELMVIVSDLDKKRLIAPSTSKSRTEQVWIETAITRRIRNYYGLWHNHPLTKRWHDEGSNDMRNGVDYSTDHPDNLSAVILEQFKQRLLQDIDS